jgi:hypothetical protein
MTTLGVILLGIAALLILSAFRGDNIVDVLRSVVTTGRTR